jgi:hypothetical protein
MFDINESMSDMIRHEQSGDSRANKRSLKAELDDGMDLDNGEESLFDDPTTEE